MARSLTELSDVRAASMSDKCKILPLKMDGSKNRMMSSA